MKSIFIIFGESKKLKKARKYYFNTLSGYFSKIKTLLMKDKNALDKPYAMLLKQGSTDAFDYFFYKYVDLVFQFSKSYLKSDFEAEEITQQVFIKLWERKASIDSNQVFKSYLFKIVINTIRDTFNAKTKENHFKLEISDYVDEKKEPGHEANFHQYLTILDELIEKLPEKRKEVFILHKKQGLTINEIAGFLKLSPKTVENTYSSAIKELRKGFADRNISGLILLYSLRFNRINLFA